MDESVLQRGVFQSFADGEVERSYRHAERTRQSLYITRMSILAAIIMAGYAILNPLFLPADAVNQVNLAGLSAIPLLMVYSWCAKQDWYLRTSAVDLMFYVSILPSMYFFVKGVTAEGDVTGWHFPNTFVYNIILVLIFASFSFAASVKGFFALTIILTAHVATTITALGYAAPVIAYSLSAYMPVAALLCFICWSSDGKARQLFTTSKALAAERQRAENLLYNVLPQQVATRLQSGEAIADSFADVTIVFVDIVGFSTLAKSMSPGRIVDLLNAYFQAADEAVEVNGLEKVKTIGDAYMAVAGAIARPSNPPKAAIEFGLDLIQRLAELSRRTGVGLRVRIGVNSGPVVGGVISTKRISYDYWGDAINIASRLQDVANPDGICVSETTYLSVSRDFEFAGPRMASLKGIGEASVYDLVGRQLSDAKALASAQS